VSARVQVPDFATTAAIGAAACVIGDILHEAVGHGGACLLTGGSALALSTVHFDCSRDTALIAAAGTLVNFAAGILCWLAARFAGRSPHLRYFLWTLMTLNLLDGAGYFLFSGIGGIGDWADVIRGLQPVWLWRGLLTVVGAVLYPLVAWFTVRELSPFLSGSATERRQQARRLTLIPYFTAGILSCVAGLLNPVGWILVLTSAAASSFGGHSALAWMWKLPTRGDPSVHAGPLTRSRVWIAAGVVLGIFFIAVLGPGLKFAGR
jgi:hypothetical protein